MRIQIIQTFRDPTTPWPVVAGSVFAVTDRVGTRLIADGRAIDMDSRIMPLPPPKAIRKKRETATR